MATIGISEAFAKYGARLKNVNWSVSAWNAAGELVLSLWAHHYRKGEDGSAEYFGKLSRWAGPGNNEFRANISDAFERKSPVRPVVVQTENIDHVESGADASKVKKDFTARVEMVGEVVELGDVNYVVRFKRG
ncbi:hypothetical protein [Massilia sp. DWR3-1-1]|uniref:hypothetical protein n=1 Tax=Massilia sp. DWR3-1-1 TaxID=2804559 RepID=UPI003CF6B352